jgi:two-component system, sensor histidine kinase PdtaS
MASLTELARFHTALDGRGVNHLQRLVAGWGLLADFCFADLLLFAPTVDSQDAEKFLVLSQVRPSTSQTVYRADWIGTTVDEEERPLVSRAFRLGEIIEGEATIAALKERVRVLCIPVRHRGEVIAVLTRESAPSFGRQPGELERTYVDIFNRFARMIAAGDFPFDAQDAETEEAPRVGDGVILLDAAARVEYTSPNGVSALHRVGVHANAEGLTFGELGLDDSLVQTAFSIGAPVTEEIEGSADVSVLIRCIPLIDHGTVSGAVVLTRDVSELRRRDRLLLSKDATIREIHHRVKNNLQTISSLLRLQGRRFSSPEAKEAIEESVRRIRAIALVHETLSREAGDDVAFVEIVRPLLRMVEEGMSSEDRPIAFRVEGDAGFLPAAVATPLSVVLNELLQNAIDHAFPPDLDLQAAPGRAIVRLRNDGERLTVTVEDDGVGVVEGFDLTAATGLGLSIVRTLVTSELMGTITIERGSGASERPGTVVRLDLPVTVPE